MITLDHVNKNSGNFLPTLWLVDKYKQYPNCVSVICNLEQKKLNENKFLKKFKEKFTNFCIWEDNVIGLKPAIVVLQTTALSTWLFYQSYSIDIIHIIFYS